MGWANIPLSYHAGLWVVDIETLMLWDWKKGRIGLSPTWRLRLVITYLTEDGVPLDSSYYDFGWTPFLWAVEYHEGYTYLSCITTGLYIVQLDIDAPGGIPLNHSRQNVSE